MFRDLSQPLHAGGLETGTWVEAAGDCVVDDGLLLLLKQLDQLLLGSDVAPDSAVGVGEEADEGGLLGNGWQNDGRLKDVTERSNAATEERLKSGHPVGTLSII
jgi:hypothetical protein